MLQTKLSHVDLVVSSLERSVPFYEGLLHPLGWGGPHPIEGERGETIHYLYVASAPGVGSIGLRERPADAPQTPYDRYALGVHHICIDVPSRESVDDRARWLARADAEIESQPREYGYTPGYYAVFFYDPDGIKLELLHRPGYQDALRGLGGA